MHELAAGELPRQSEIAGRRSGARLYLAKRGLAPETVEQFGLGYSDRSGRALLRLFEQRGFPAAQMEESGLVGKRQDGSFYDRFRNRLMFPIHNESGKIIGFGGRALAADDEPKYLNSPETPIYKKSHVLYNLHRAKEAIRKEDRAILVEGYMDAIGVTAAGFRDVVASCGTALTAQQVQAIKRHSDRIVVNFDPDAAGREGGRAIHRSAAGRGHAGAHRGTGWRPRSRRILQGARRGGLPGERVDGAKGYFYWLADRARAKYDMRTSEGKVAVLQLPAAGGADASPTGWNA